MNRTNLQQLSLERIEDARVLLAAARWSGAYYLSGYAIECALKSCVLAYIERTGVVFEDKKYADQLWTHDFEVLIKKADLDAARGLTIQANPQFGANWTVLSEWRETSRYQTISQSSAVALFNAITDQTNGVLPWVQKHL